MFLRHKFSFTQLLKPLNRCLLDLYRNLLDPPQMALWHDQAKNARLTLRQSFNATRMDWSFCCGCRSDNLCNRHALRIDENQSVFRGKGEREKKKNLRKLGCTCVWRQLGSWKGPSNGSLEQCCWVGIHVAMGLLLSNCGFVVREVHRFAMNFFICFQKN